MIPISIVPWDRDFVTALAGHLLDRFHGDFRDVLVVFPHRRPKRYLLNALNAEKRLAKPCLLPSILSVGDLFADLARGMWGEPLRCPGELDRVGVLHQVVRALRPGLRGADDAFPEAIKDFFPWGLRLAGLMEELFQHGVAAADLDHVSDLVLPTAATLLGNLKTIQTAYRKALLDSGSATEGLMSALVGAEPARAARLLADKRVLACGFYALTGCEEALLKALWRAGQAEILWHTDPAVARPDDQPHWSCREHVEWLKRWKAKAHVLSDVKHAPLPAWSRKSGQLSLLALDPEPPARRAAVTFHQGFDLHSQLAALRRELDKAGDTAGYAVVLPDTSMLMPVLHHLPRRDVNVSMGYPLARSPVFQLMEIVLRLQDGRTPQGYHWREVIACLRHPLLTFLQVGDGHPLRPLFHAWEQAIRSGEKYLDPLAWRPDPDDLAATGDPAAVEALRERVIRTCFTAFEDLITPRAMALALLDLAGLLLDPAHGTEHWRRFVIDAQCLSRLVDAVIPELHDCAMSREEFPPEAVRTMVRELVASQRAPFEADPIAGLQVLGMLETRLLTFERVFILGASEENLPGQVPPDPLLPDPLRQSLDLPDARTRDMVAAHTFHRLIQGAREVGIFYSSGVKPGILDAKSQPSRYVEQLLWEEEKRQGRLLGPDDPPRRLIELPMRPAPLVDPAAANTAACRIRLDTFLRYKGLSPTFIDDFLHCPLRFFFKYLTALKPLEEVAEEGDPPALGQLVHSLLQDLFQPRLGHLVEPGDLDPEDACARFDRALAREPFFSRMPAYARLMLERTGHERLRAALAAMPAGIPMALELAVDGSVDLDGETHRVRGAIDRVDRRGPDLVVLDYKTGKPRLPARSFWDDEALWAWIGHPEPGRDLSLLPRLAEALGSIQMPLYLNLHHQKTGVLPENGLYVPLGHGGAEVPLFAPATEADRRREIVLERTPELVRFCLRLMRTAEAFVPVASRACAWCPYQPACGRRAPD